jgi:hypothetical protein
MSPDLFLGLPEVAAPKTAWTQWRRKVSRAMDEDDLDLCRRRVAEYAATRGQRGFDQQKLNDMVNGCALRQELLRTDLKVAEMKALLELIERERNDLWS